MKTELVSEQESTFLESGSCLQASHRLHEALCDLGAEIDRTSDASVAPPRPLPIDDFLAEMGKRKNAPGIVINPKRLKDELWTESVTAFVYAGIERAFVAAGRMPGENTSGHTRELQNLIAWVNRQLDEPRSEVPDFFAVKTARLFASGILKDRREERIEVLHRIRDASPSDCSDLFQLKAWVLEDLAACELAKKGRPADYQKIMFAAEIANLWNSLTGRPLSRGPETNFAQFLLACWKSGAVKRQLETSFKITLRDHIEEVPDQPSCGKCAKCEQNEDCTRRRYYGILNRRTNV